MGSPRTVERWWWFAAGPVVVVDGILAVRADASHPSAQAWLTVVDVLTGATFVLAALAAKGPAAQRLWMASVGLVWLAGSWLPVASTVHQGLLVIALAAFPSGRLTGRRSAVVAAAGMVVAAGLLPQPAIGLVFVGAALATGTEPARGKVAQRYAAFGAGACGLVLLTLWWTARSGSAAVDPDLALLAWGSVLAVVAIAFTATSRAAVRERRLVAERAMAGAATIGVQGLAEVLGPALGDPALRIEPLPAAGPRADGALAGHPSAGSGPQASVRLVVHEHGRPVAVVTHRAPALDDPLTAQAVSSAVRLTMAHVRLQQEQQQLLADLAASRLRLLEATDRARAEVATELRSGVGDSLTHVGEVVSAVRDGALRTSAGPAGARAVAALDIVLAELQTLDHEIGAFVQGVLPFDLGEGRLTAALQALADGSPVPCTLRLGDAVGSDPVAEATLYYVCSEALANAVKHARASAVEIELSRKGADLAVTVTDDGVGGADPRGSGLRGLADRVAAHGGRLRVVSAPGGGTVVSGSVPAISRSAAMA